VYREIKDFCPVPRDMSDEGVTFTVAHRNDRPVPLERGRGARLGILFTVCLVILSAGVGIGARPVSASCTPGWVLISQQDDSFTWDEGFLSIRAVSWTGSVRLLENLDSDCYVTDITLRYTGPLPGGTLEVTGDPFVSFTVQYPDPFVDSGDVATNAYGDLFSWNPHTAPLVQPRFDINDRGADEFRVQGQGPLAILTGVKASFQLPLDLLGETVNAQIHVGPDFCECSVTPVYLPGTAPPPPPPPTSFDFALSVDPASGSVAPGDSATATVTATLDSGTPNAVSFSASGLPPDTTASFDPTDCVPTCATTMTLTTSSTTPDGTYSVSVEASDGTTTRKVDYTLQVHSPPPPSEVWGVFVHAHEDDWQLFLSPESTSEYTAGRRLLIIYVTAGDAGGPQSTWLAREDAAMASVRYIVGAASESNGSATICYSGATTNTCHAVWQWNYGTTVSIFMRVPDGNTDGNGFPATGMQSLSKLRDGTISSLATVDGATTYNSWQDLYSTIGAIITNFAPYDATTKVNAPDFDRFRQSFEGKTCQGCGDHEDHLAVADAVHNITIEGSAPWGRAWYIDYSICWADSRYPVNLDSAAYQLKKDTFMAYNNRLAALTGVDTYAQMPSFWEECFHREYSREV